MNSFNTFRNLVARAGAYLFVCAAVAALAWTQDVSTSTVQHGPSSFETKVRNADVVYVEGNDLVIKAENGRLEHLVVPHSDKFHIDGREASVYDLKPGMKLTETITTTTTPRYVKTIRTIEGKVWHVNPPKTVILTLPDHKHMIYDVPSHATFTINDEPQTVFELRKGMQFKATIVKDEPETVIESAKHVVAKAPPAPVIPQEVGTLLIEETKPEVEETTPEAPVTTARADPPEALPETGSSLPLVGWLGAFATAASLGLRLYRRAAS
jgi:hypothetical protein